MRPTRKALAASFVMTFTAGCDSKETAPPAAPTVDVGPGSAPSSLPAQALAEAASASGSAAPNASVLVARTVPPAPSTGHVVRHSDGTCIWFADVQCPRSSNGHILPCNPPRPHEVQC